MAGLAIVSYRLTDEQLGRRTDDFLRERAEEIVGGQREGPDRRGRGDGNGRGDNDVVGPVTTLPPLVDSDAIVQIIDGDGVVVEGSGATLPVTDADIKVAQGGRTMIRSITVDGDSYRMVTVDVPGNGAVQVARSVGGDERVLEELRWQLVALAAGLVAAAGVAGWLLMRRATEPLEQLTAATERVTSSRDLTPLRLERDDEVGRLADSFDEMLLALAESREQQRQLVQDAGHELRTPLTSLRANIEFMQHAGSLPDAEREELLDALQAETQALGELVDEIVALASGDDADDATLVELDLADVVVAAVRRFERRSDRTVELVVEPSPVIGNDALLDRAVTNLLGNADKFSPTAEPIEVRCAAGTVTVRDHGPGFDPDDLPKVFGRFYRAPAARDLPGSGLGLSIVAQVADLHGGTAAAANAPGGGAVVTLHLHLSSSQV
jgi:two-component system sensor histidine kinase MprB